MTTHLIRLASGALECCGKTPFEVSRGDRCTTDPDLATCVGGEVLEAQVGAIRAAHDADAAPRDLAHLARRAADSFDIVGESVLEAWVVSAGGDRFTTDDLRALADLADAAKAATASREDAQRALAAEVASLVQHLRTMGTEDREEIAEALEDAAVMLERLAPEARGGANRAARNIGPCDGCGRGADRCECNS